MKRASADSQKAGTQKASVPTIEMTISFRILTVSPISISKTRKRRTLYLLKRELLLLKEPNPDNPLKIGLCRDGDAFINPNETAHLPPEIKIRLSYPFSDIRLVTTKTEENSFQKSAKIIIPFETNTHPKGQRRMGREWKLHG
ncbi:MAG: hypothetical protein ACLT8E_01070 [Akkermansia sp.]